MCAHDDLCAEQSPPVRSCEAGVRDQGLAVLGL